MEAEDNRGPCVSLCYEFLHNLLWLFPQETALEDGNNIAFGMGQTWVRIPTPPSTFQLLDLGFVSLFFRASVFSSVKQR